MTALLLLLLPCLALGITMLMPYVALSPAAASEISVKRGIASWYGPAFHGRRTANGERFDMNKLTAAHRSLAFGTRVKVTNPDNGRSVTVRINDRGPYAGRRTIDLSREAARRIGLTRKGVGRVLLQIR